ncbi:MAG: UDP-3-O-(3-hydroxymyristoyl)glucosamine N-acyltransferase [Betaproteobacteria bacterium]
MPSVPAGLPLSELAARTGATVEGDGSVRIVRVGTLESGGAGAIAFLSNPRYRAQLAATRAGAVIVAPGVPTPPALPRLVAADPYATYARIAAILHPSAAPEPGIHPSAAVDSGARVATSASIGALAVIGRGATIGERTQIGAGCVIGDDATIGNDCALHANVTVYPRSVIGPRALILGGAVIGGDGFGMAEEGGRWLRIPQIGRVVIGADVEIGANTTIDRGALDDTIVENDVKLDNQVQIGHNCRIGAHTAIAGCVGVAGSTRIGKSCKIGGAAMIGGHLEIADGTVISAATQIYDSITEAGIYTGAFPGLPHREWQHVASNFRRLRELAGRVRALERKAGVVAGADGPHKEEP